MSPARRYRLILAGSIAFNLFAAAFITAQRVRSEMAGRVLPAIIAQTPAGRVAERIFERLAGGLSAHDADIVHQAILAHRPELAATQQDFINAVGGLQTVLQAEKLDTQKLQPAIEKARLARQEIGPVVEAIMMQALPQISPQGRQSLARFRFVR
jgi:uncharacterized membrane protein